jgi:ribonuclease P protein component
MAAPEGKRLRFNREQRIKQGRDFARIRKGGQRLANGCLLANWMASEPGKESRLGVITSGKIGGAIVRSRARRLLREAFRIHQYDLAVPVDLVLVARASIVGKTYSQVENDLLTTLQKARLLKRKRDEPSA